MAWTYEALRAALAGLGALDDAAAAAALAAEVVAEVRDIPTAEVRAILLETGEWGGITLLSRRVPSPEVPAEAVAAAITVLDTLSLTTTLEVTQAATWAAVQQVCAGLEAAGVVSPATVARILALRQVTRPAWSPAPTQYDVAAARRLGE